MASQYGHATERDRMIEDVWVFRNSEFQKLEQADLVERQEKKKETERKNKKSSFRNWFSSGDNTLMMSDEAKRIHANLER